MDTENKEKLRENSEGRLIQQIVERLQHMTLREIRLVLAFIRGLRSGE